MVKLSPLIVHATRRAVMDVEPSEAQHHQHCLSGEHDELAYITLHALINIA